MPLERKKKTREEFYLSTKLVHVLVDPRRYRSKSNITLHAYTINHHKLFIKTLLFYN